jgi:chaperonin GroES
MNISPFYDRLIIEELSLPDEQTSGGLWVPPSNSSPRIGIIMAMGPNKAKGEIGWDEVPFSVGDTVLWLRHMGSEMQVGEKKLWIVRFEDLLGKVEG